MSMTTRGTHDMTATPTVLPRAWIVRGEKEGVDEEFNLRECVASIHWNDFPNPFTHEKADLEAYGNSRLTDPDAPGPHAARQIWEFTHDIPVGALIVMPRLHAEHQGEVAIGWCRGPAYPVLRVSDNLPNLRLPVEWVVTNMSRAKFDTQTQQSFKTLRHTVSEIHSSAVIADILRRLRERETADEAR